MKTVLSRRKKIGMLNKTTNCRQRLRDWRLTEGSKAGEIRKLSKRGGKKEKKQKNYLGRMGELEILIKRKPWHGRWSVCSNGQDPQSRRKDKEKDRG